MGGNNSSALSTEQQLEEVRRLLRRWADDQDHQTNSALRSQYTRVTSLMDQLNERLSDRQHASQERLERQVTELKQQLEKVQKKMESKDEAGPSGNRINDLLNDLASTLMKSAMDEKRGKGADNFLQKTSFNMNYSSPMGTSFNMNYSSPMGSQGYGPAGINQQHYGGPQVGQRYPGPYPPNPSMFHQNYAPNQAPPPYEQPHDYPSKIAPPPYQPTQDYPPNQVPPPYQQPYSFRGAHPGNPGTQYFPHNFNAPRASTNIPNQPARNPTTNPTSRFPSQPHQNQTTTENVKSEKSSKKFSKASAEKSKNQEQKSSVPKTQNVNKGAQKSTDPMITKITKAFEESRNSQQKKRVELEDIEKIEKMVAQFKLQLETEKEKSETIKSPDGAKKTTEHEQKTSAGKSYQKDDTSAKKRWNPPNTKRCDRTEEAGDRRDLFKSRGQGRGSHQQWKNKNRQARKKSNTRNINKDELDSDSNESVSSNFSYVSKASTVPASSDTNKRVFWTTRPNYARDFNFARVKSKLESVTQGLDLEDIEDASECAPSGLSDNGGREDVNKNAHEERKESVDENKPSTSRDSSMSVRRLDYPSEEEAMNQGMDIHKPLKEPVIFVGKTETGEQGSHFPKCLADIYELEKKYRHFNLICLS